jgi:hypothetical protein
VSYSTYVVTSRVRAPTLQHSNRSIINKLVIWDVVPVKELKGCLKYVNAAIQVPKAGYLLVTLSFVRCVVLDVRGH